MKNFDDDSVISLDDLCRFYWTTKTPNAIKQAIYRGELYEFLYKIGRQWVTKVGDFKKWQEKQKIKQQQSRR